MRLVITNEGGGKMNVGVDGYFYLNLDSTGLSEDIHAVQWYESQGEIEKKDPVTGKMTANEEITSVDAFQFAIDAWNVAYQAEQDAIAAAQAADEQAQAEENPV